MYRIFIEGEGNEKKFLEQFINHIWPNHEAEFSIISVGGWTKLNLVKNQFVENTDFGGKNIVIFDADDTEKDPDHGGFILRKAKLESELSTVEHNLFLFPINQIDGDFELLLEQSINQEHNRILICFSKYESCLSSYINPDTNETVYNIPVRKSKIYSYIDSFRKSNKQHEKMKGGDWLFYKPEIWDLNNVALQHLKDFLLNIFNN